MCALSFCIISFYHLIITFLHITSFHYLVMDISKYDLLYIIGFVPWIHRKVTIHIKGQINSSSNISFLLYFRFGKWRCKKKKVPYQLLPMATGRVRESVSVLSLPRCFYAWSYGPKIRSKRIKNFGKKMQNI